MIVISLENELPEYVGYANCIEKKIKSCLKYLTFHVWIKITDMKLSSSAYSTKKLCIIHCQNYRYPSLCDALFSIWYIRWYITMDSTKNAWSITMWYTRRIVCRHQLLAVEFKSQCCKTRFPPTLVLPREKVVITHSSFHEAVLTCLFSLGTR